jgi:hypothetical protein
MSAAAPVKEPKTGPHKKPEAIIGSPPTPKRRASIPAKGILILKNLERITDIATRYAEKISFPEPFLPLNSKIPCLFKSDLLFYKPFNSNITFKNNKSCITIQQQYYFQKQQALYYYSTTI